MLEGDWKSECDDRINAYDDWVKENGVKWMLQEYGIQSDMHSLETVWNILRICWIRWKRVMCHIAITHLQPTIRFVCMTDRK